MLKGSRWAAFSILMYINLLFTLHNVYLRYEA
jgi:hypothetical protein